MNKKRIKIVHNIWENKVNKQLFIEIQSKNNQNKIYKLIQNKKTQYEINILLDRYTNEALKHLDKLKHHACYNEILDLIAFSKIRKI